MKYKKRCRLYGGAEGLGAQKGERNGNYKHGLYTNVQKAMRQKLRNWVKIANQFTR